MATMQFKYKVGDKVRVISKFTESDRYRNYKMHNNFSYGHPVDGWAFIPTMREEYAGKVVTIKSLDVEQNCYHIDDSGVRWTDEMFEGLAVENNKIVITHDGKTTTATLYRENGSKEVATAKCCPEDTFDFNVGAKLAMERLMEKTKKPEPPKYYNGKVVCINTGNVFTHLKVGKIYNFVDGNCKTERGNQITNSPVKDCEDLNSRFISGVKFIPIVE